MSTIISDQSPHRNSSTQLIAESFLSGQGLPMANVLSADRILAIFKKHDSLFGENIGAVFNTAITLWAFTTQLLCDGKQRSCSATVSRVIAYCKNTSRKIPSVDTGNYCSAREAQPQSHSQVDSGS